MLFFAKHTEDSIGLIFQRRYSGGIYFTGNTEYTPDLLGVKDKMPAILFVCINGKLGNMSYKDAAKLAIQLGIKIVFQSHYGIFAEKSENPDNFVRVLYGPNVNCVCIRLMEKEELYDLTAHLHEKLKNMF